MRGIGEGFGRKTLEVESEPGAGSAAAGPGRWLNGCGRCSRERHTMATAIVISAIALTASQRTLKCFLPPLAPMNVTSSSSPSDATLLVEEYPGPQKKNSGVVGRNLPKS